MKRTLLIVLLGLFSGVASHTLWYELRKPVGTNQVDADLLWMKSTLKLTDAQYQEIKMLHDHSSPKLIAIATQVARMRDEFDAFERERKTEGRVDFVEFARFVDMRRKVDNECLQSTRSLVQATARVMTPQQRELYLGIVGTPLGDRAARSN